MVNPHLTSPFIAAQGRGNFKAYQGLAGFSQKRIGTWSNTWISFMPGIGIFLKKDKNQYILKLTKETQKTKEKSQMMDAGWRESKREQALEEK